MLAHKQKTLRRIQHPINLRLHSRILQRELIKSRLHRSYVGIFAVRLQQFVRCAHQLSVPPRIAVHIDITLQMVKLCILPFDSRAKGVLRIWVMGPGLLWLAWWSPLASLRSRRSAAPRRDPCSALYLLSLLSLGMLLRFGTLLLLLLLRCPSRRLLFW